VIDHCALLAGCVLLVTLAGWTMPPNLSLNADATPAALRARSGPPVS